MLLPVMLVLSLGLKAKFCGLGLRGLALAKNQGQNLGRLQNSPLTSIHWSTVTGMNYISRSTLLTYILTVGKRGLVRVLENSVSLLFIVTLCIMGWPWPWLWPWQRWKWVIFRDP